MPPSGYDDRSGLKVDFAIPDGPHEPSLLAYEATGIGRKELKIKRYLD